MAGRRQAALGSDAETWAGGVHHSERDAGVSNGDEEVQMWMPKVFFSATGTSGESAEARRGQRPDVLDATPELSWCPDKFVSITSTDFECLEVALKLRHQMDSYRTCLQFERRVYRVKWEGGGKLTARVYPPKKMYKRACFDLQ